MRLPQALGSTRSPPRSPHASPTQQGVWSRASLELRFHFTLGNGEQAPASSHLGPHRIPFLRCPDSLMISKTKTKGKWEKQEAKTISLGRTQNRPSQSGENPKRRGYYWQVLAGACKGFNVQRGETVHMYAALYN